MEHLEKGRTYLFNDEVFTVVDVANGMYLGKIDNHYKVRIDAFTDSSRFIIYKNNYASFSDGCEGVVKAKEDLSPFFNYVFDKEYKVIFVDMTKII